MIAFPVVGSVVQQRGWRVAWFAIGLALIALLSPLCWIVVRRSPEAVGLAPDGLVATTDGPMPAPEERPTGYSWTSALATPAFWTFAVGTALYGLVASGIGLFNESILRERGFDASVYYQTLVVTAITALAGNFLGGWLAFRVSLPKLMAVALFVLAAGLMALPHVSTLAHVMAWATAMGLGGGLVMVLFFSVWARVFGRRQLGVIQGAAQMMTVLASAIGPLLLAWCLEWTGSYTPVFRILAAATAAVALSALFTPVPPPATT
jgi:MFS family permease